MLVHGAGFAIELTDADHELLPHDVHVVHVRLMANVPGRYTDELIIDMDNMPRAVIPVTFHVEGKAVVLDPFTSGLTVAPDIRTARLQMPPVIPGVGSVKRTLTVTSRCPRELVLTANVVEWGAAVRLEHFVRAAESTPVAGAAASSDEAAAATVSLALVDQSTGGAASRPTSGPSRATVTPDRIVLPPLQTTQIVLQYTPPDHAGADFHASLVLRSAPHLCASNDRFFVDEFYLLNAGRFPAKRYLTPPTVIAKEGIQVRGVPKVPLRHPLVDRPGVVAGGVVVAPDEEMLLVMQNSSANSTAGAATTGAATAASPASPSRVAADDDSDDDANVGSSGATKKNDNGLEERLRAARNATKATLAEREELSQFIALRRQEAADSWARHVRPIELELHVTHLHPKLVTDPPEILRMPMCRVGDINARTMTMRNEGTAPMDFRLAIAEGPFKIVKTMLRASNSTQVVDFATSKLAASFRSGRPASRDSDPSLTLFRLRPSDVLEVTVQLSNIAELVKHHVHGLLHVIFSNGNHVQPVPLLATVHVPVVDVESAELHFRPTVAVTGGRKQPVHQRIVRLINPTTCAAKFVIKHDPSQKPLTRGASTLTRAAFTKTASSALAAAASQPVGSPDSGRTHTLKSSTLGLAAAKSTALGATGGAAEANNVVLRAGTGESDLDKAVDDPTRFHFEVTEGVIGPASAGSQPTYFDVPVTFAEHATTLFECDFIVEVDGGVGTRFTLRGESRSTEL